MIEHTSNITMRHEQNSRTMRKHDEAFSIACIAACLIASACCFCMALSTFA